MNKVLELALAALSKGRLITIDESFEVIAALKEAIAKQGEPVLYLVECQKCVGTGWVGGEALGFCQPGDVTPCPDCDGTGVPPNVTSAPIIPADVAKDAAMYRFLVTNRPVLLLTGFFGNGCTNKTIEDVEAAINKSLSAAPKGEPE